MATHKVEYLADPNCMKLKVGDMIEVEKGHAREAVGHYDAGFSVYDKTGLGLWERTKSGEWKRKE